MGHWASEAKAGFLWRNKNIWILFKLNNL
jgi:hypothetical protein